MSANDALAAWLGEALAPLGVLRFKKMFGGVGVYLDGWFFALLAGGELWLKADVQNTPAFEAQGSPLFSYEFNGKIGSMNYRRAPEDCLDDGEALRDWVMMAVGAAQRAKK
ncbi:MAG: TfoX/Sxy family protein [Polymorphobacter sp.]